MASSDDAILSAMRRAYPALEIQSPRASAQDLLDQMNASDARAGRRKTVVSPPLRRHAPVMEGLEARCLFSSVAGEWCGTRTEAGLRGRFALVAVELNLTQSGTLAAGTEERTTPRAPQFFADLLTHGTVLGDTFVMRDHSIIAMRRPANYKWLLYTATLRISSDGQSMTGRWHAGGVHGTMTFQLMPSGT